MSKNKFKIIGAISITIISILILASMWIFFYKGNEDNPIGKIEKGLDIDITSKDVKKDIDTHKSVKGPGERFIEIDCEKNNKALKNNLEKYYPKLPLSEELENLIYNELKHMKLASKIPKVESGYYYFIDKNIDNSQENNNGFSEKKERKLYNIILALYDIDTNIIYYYQLDS